jgi:hypothetical protein
MKRLLFIILVVTGCGSTPKKSVQTYNRDCAPTAVQAKDMARFNVTPVPGKVMVVRFMRSACPYCREDLQQAGLMFKIGKWDADKINLILIAYKKEGVETRQTFDTFVRTELAKTSFPIEKAQIIFLDRTYPELLVSKNENGELILSDWKAVPYSLVFAKDGRLAYRGHFTMIPSQQHSHYDFITSMQDEKCEPKAAP